MAGYRLTPRAGDDLTSIWTYIAARNEPAADRVVHRLFDRMEQAAHHPAMGAPRPALSPTARILVEGSHILIYEPMSDGILVVAIMHARRHPDAWQE